MEQNADRLIADAYMTTQEATAALGYSVQHTRLLVRQGRLRAERFGRDWMIVRESVAEYQRLLAFDSDTATVTAPSPEIVNVATVPMRSPFRYPGGKTWLVPRIRQWLGNRDAAPAELVEPFAGGAIVGLTAAFENLAERVTLVEIDEDVAAVWQTILGRRGRHLADRIASFELSRDNAGAALRDAGKSVEDRAFATILRNRINRGGILAPGAGIVKNGENGRGIMSRWYPLTLRKRILDIISLADRIHFVKGDAIQVMRERSREQDAAFFIDPPYTVAGRRLYAHSEIDHGELFQTASRLRGDFLMTYDDAAEIHSLARRHGFRVGEVLMKNTHHEKKVELLLSRDLDWLRA